MEIKLGFDLWISIALAIPLAIVANLFTPRFQGWLDSRLERSKKEKLEKRQKARQEQLKGLRKELTEVTLHHSDKQEMNQLFLTSLIKVAMYGALGSIYGAMFPFIGEFLGWGGLGGTLVRAGAQMTALVVAMLIFITCARAMRIHKKVRDFDSYQKNTKQLISALERDNV